MSKLNLFFFGEERIAASDALWFYGVQIAVLSLLVFLKAITLVC